MKRTPTPKPVRSPQRTPQRLPSEREMKEDIERILARLDAEIPEAKKEMDALLSRLRATRIVNAA